jgi:glycosyltransferase involved in cell wall biosynthesis
MAVVVLSFRGRATLPDAVRSLLAQDVGAEIVVVHSGGGGVRERLAAAGLNPRVIEVPERLLPGGARNLGIASTSAPHVAFLADDCIAEPGWLRARLRAHEEGAAAVASALLSHKPNNPVALAAHLSLFIRRMPRMAASQTLCYGASYDRRLFEAHGVFRDDLEGGEDTEFHQRLAPAEKPVWRPEVRTVHVGAETLIAFLSDQLRRGRRIAQAWREIAAFSGAAVAKDAVERTAFIFRHAFNVVEPQQRWAVVLALPLIALGNLVYAAGALSVGSRA